MAKTRLPSKMSVIKMPARQKKEKCFLVEQKLFQNPLFKILVIESVDVNINWCNPAYDL